MGAYSTIDPAIAGMKQGLSARAYTRISQEINGINFGLPVFSYIGNDSDCFLYHNNKVTLTLNKAMSGVDTIVITINGVVVSTVTFTTDMPTTGALIVAAIQSAIPGAIVTVTDNASNGNTWLIYNVEIQDSNDRVATGVTTGSGVVVAPTYSSTMQFEGYAMYTQKEAAVKTDLSGNVIVPAFAMYKQSDAVNIMVIGWIWVNTDAAVNSDLPVYCVKTGANEGLSSIATSGLALTGVTFKSTTTSAGLALVRVNL